MTGFHFFGGSFVVRINAEMALEWLQTTEGHANGKDYHNDLYMQFISRFEKPLMLCNTHMCVETSYAVVANLSCQWLLSIAISFLTCACTYLFPLCSYKQILKMRAIGEQSTSL